MKPSYFPFVSVSWRLNGQMLAKEDLVRVMERWGVRYLCSSRFGSFPLQTREDVVEEKWVVVDFGLLELGVFEVEREREGGGLAGFYGAGEEIDR